MRSCVIYGGTFDPPHLGHKMVVETIKELNLGEIIIIPNKKPYYKDAIKTSDEDRLSMVKLMFGDCKIDLYEIENNIYTPTYDTLLRYQKEYDEIYFVLGSDSYETIDSWHHYDELINAAKFIVFNRGNNISLIKDSDILVNNKIIDISSTELRSNIEEKNLTKEVYEYILEKGLYAK